MGPYLHCVDGLDQLMSDSGWRSQTMLVPSLRAYLPGLQAYIFQAFGHISSRPSGISSRVCRPSFQDVTPACHITSSLSCASARKVFPTPCLFRSVSAPLHGLNIHLNECLLLGRIRTCVHVACVCGCCVLGFAAHSFHFRY